MVIAIERDPAVGVRVRGQRGRVANLDCGLVVARDRFVVLHFKALKELSVHLEGAGKLLLVDGVRCGAGGNKQALQRYLDLVAHTLPAAIGQLELVKAHRAQGAVLILDGLQRAHALGERNRLFERLADLLVVLAVGG